MSDVTATLAATLANPECDTTRLAHADAIQESTGDESLAALIRAGVPCGCIYLHNGMVCASTPDCGTCQRKLWLRRCEHEGCRNAGRLCVLEVWERDPGPDDKDTEEFFCPAHAPEHGYCSACGAFWSGIDSFENSGLCDPCADEIENDYEDSPEDYDGEQYPDEF